MLMPTVRGLGELPDELTTSGARYPEKVSTGLAEIGSQIEEIQGRLEASENLSEDAAEGTTAGLSALGAAITSTAGELKTENAELRGRVKALEDRLNRG